MAADLYVTKVYLNPLIDLLGHRRTLVDLFLGGTLHRTNLWYHIFIWLIFFIDCMNKVLFILFIYLFIHLFIYLTVSNYQQ